jgi:NADH-quinone oxidoreductase subunit L
MYFLVFHGQERFGREDHGHHGDDPHNDADHHGLAPGEKPHEAPWVVTLPLILLAIPSVVIGYIAIEPMLYGDFFKGVIFVNSEAHPAMEELAREFHGALAMGLHALTALPTLIALAGVAAAFYCYMINPKVPAWFYKHFRAIYTLLDQKYYMDRINEVVFARGARLLGRGLWGVGDRTLIDGLVVNGSARVVGWFSALIRHLQSGYIYHYAFVMILGVLFFLIYFMPFPSFAK